MIKTVTCIAHKRLKDVATKCVLTAVKASKCICLPPDTLACSPRKLHSWIWEAERTGEGRGGKGLRKGSGERK